MDRTIRILVVDDDPHIAKLLSAYIAREDWSAVTARDGEEALELLSVHGAELVLLDIMMPKLDGIAVCAEIRAVSDVPVILLTAKDRETDKITGLSIGADDYITKPFSAREVVARIKAVLRRTGAVRSIGGQPAAGAGITGTGRVSGLENAASGGPAGSGSDPGTLTTGPIAMDLARHEVTVSGHKVRLTSTEFELLRHFMLQPGRVFTKEQLLRSVWKQEYATDHNTVMVHIRRLRKKLEENPDEPEFIRTVWGIGYRLEEIR